MIADVIKGCTKDVLFNLIHFSIYLLFHLSIYFLVKAQQLQPS